MSNQQYQDINEPIIGSSRDTSSFPAGSAKSGQDEPVGSSKLTGLGGLGAKLDPSTHQAGQSSHTENLGQRHPVWSDVSQTGSNMREGFGSQQDYQGQGLGLNQQTGWSDTSKVGSDWSDKSNIRSDLRGTDVTQGLGSQQNYQGQGMGQGTSSWTDTSKVGSDQRENLGSYSTSSTYPSSTTGLGTSFGTTGTNFSSSPYQTYSTDATYPSTTTGLGTSYDSNKQSDWIDSSKTSPTESHVSDQHISEQHKDKSEHKSTTEKIKEKAHLAAEKIKEAFS